MHDIPETFLLPTLSINNFLKDKSIHKQANTVNSLKATTSHKQPFCINTRFISKTLS